MTRTKYPRDLLADAYTASSLLQKAMRRGETELALMAAERLLPKRGKGIWRRLLAIAFEDVGIANVALLARILELAETQLSSRELPANQCLANAVESLASSSKSRSADHLICSARQSYQAKSAATRAMLSDAPAMLAIAGDPSQPLIERMAALEDPCGRNERGARAAQLERLSALKCVLPVEAHDAIDLSIRGFKLLKDGIALPLPLLVSTKSEVGQKPTISNPEMPEAAYVNGIPAWVWDKHTSIGKRAFRRLVYENEPIASCLHHYVSPEHHLGSACMAGFYLDAAPVSLRCDWPGSVELELAGHTADMAKIGCPPCGIDPLMEVVAENIGHLNEIRVELAGGKSA